ncbi:hypothetical protein [Chryseobacterium sp. A301]
MENFVFIVFLLLCFAILLSTVKRRKHSVKVRLVRVVIVLGASAFFAYWFVQKSYDQLVPNSMAVQIINKLPQPVDFYAIKLDSTKLDSEKFDLRHAGKIRSEHYRLEYLQMDNSDEYWLAGYIGKKNLVYFSQHAVPNKNMDQIIEINNYINQSLKLSQKAMTLVEAKRVSDMSTSVWVTLSLLLLFLNTALLFKK